MFTKTLTSEKKMAFENRTQNGVAGNNGFTNLDFDFDLNEEDLFGELAKEHDQVIDIYAHEINESESEKEDETNGDVAFSLIQKHRSKVKVNVAIGPLSVSMMTAMAKITYPIDVIKFGLLAAADYKKNILEGKNPDFSIMGIKFIDNKKNFIILGENGGKKKNPFPNCVTMSIRSPFGKRKPIHVKIFTGKEDATTRSITMAGCKIKEDGAAVMKILEQYMRKKRVLFGGKNWRKERRKFKIVKYEITNVNSNYEVGFEIDRNLLYGVLCREYPNLSVSYEPLGYAGVKIGFFYNQSKKVQNGICECPKMCIGKGNGLSVGNCKKVTVSVFQKGSVVNTGSRGMVQTMAAYHFINSLIEKHANEIVLINLVHLLSELDLI